MCVCVHACVRACVRDGVCLQELLIGQLLKSRDLEGSVAAVRKLTSVPRDALTTLLITKTLGKSGNPRHRHAQYYALVKTQSLVLYGQTKMQALFQLCNV